ncbi:MAG: hypothetical protein LUE14_02500 [Clostridiales bacterium]|nr:hypothetical protein [Clostridiales bacterium]
MLKHELKKRDLYLDKMIAFQDTEMIKVLPLSFKEFLGFHGYIVTEKKTPSDTVRKRITDADGDVYDARELFGEYARYGGMPMLADVGMATILQ